MKNSGITALNTLEFLELAIAECHIKFSEFHKKGIRL